MEEDPGAVPDEAATLDRLTRRAEQAAERYAPAYVVIDRNFDVRHFSGRTGRFLDPTPGAATLNLLKLAHPDLRSDLRTALLKAREERRPVHVGRLSLTADHDRRAVSLTVEPLRDGAEEPDGFMVLFQTSGAVETEPGAAPVSSGDERVRRLETELSLTRGRLRSAVEQLEKSDAQLKASSEGYRSIDEAMRSANEELEASRRELQSVNDELQAVNGELASRIADLAKVNDDLKNLLESTQIATIFLDNEVRVRTFTPAAVEMFGLAERDAGRPLTQILAKLPYPELQADVQKVLRSLATVEREVGGADGDYRFLARVLPYRSTDNFIAGAVLTFLDVTELTRAEAEQKRLIAELAGERARLETILDSLPVAVLIADVGSGKIITGNRRYTELMGEPAPQSLHYDSVPALHRLRRTNGQPLGPEECPLWRAVHGDAAEPEVLEGRRPDGGRLVVEASSAPARDPDTAEVHWAMLVLEDASERRHAEERLRLLLAELQHRVRNILSVVRSLAERSVETSGSLEDFSMHFEGRLDALSRTQNVLTRTGDISVDLEEIVRDELLAHAVMEEQVEVSGPPVRLRQRAAEPVSLAIHELATNAVKYGALCSPGGRISVTWRTLNTEAGPRLSLEWRESGVRVLDAAPTRVGFGRDLIERGLPFELGAATSLEFLPGGVRAFIELPLNDKNAVQVEEPSEPDGTGEI